MKKLTAILLFTLVIVFSNASTSQAATTGDYRSHQTGNWNATATWEYYNGSAWVTAPFIDSSPPQLYSVMPILVPG